MGRSKPGRFEFVCTSSERSSREISREEFCSRLSRILAEQFPDEALEYLTVSPDLEHSLSGNYARSLLRHGRSYMVGGDESTDRLENSLTFALLWLERARQSARRGSVTLLRLILPKGATLGVEWTQVHWAIFRHGSWRAVKPRGHIRARCGSDARSFSSLSRASLCPVERRACFFGSVDPREELTAIPRPSLKRLLGDLESRRHPFASDTHHPLYRAQAERWLESLVREDVTRIDAKLDPRFVYAQVFANAGGEHGIS